MCFTGISVDYWGPFTYTFALACPVFAFLFSGGSKFASDDGKKFSLFSMYCIALYIIGISMLVQWLNKLCWILLFSVPNYNGIVMNFMDLIRPAFTALACYVPLMTFYPFFKKMYTSFADTKDIRDSIADYNGIDLSDTKEGWGPYTCEMFICKDGETGKTIKIPECRRFESTLIVGTSGSGKTTMAFEPMIARDIEKKYFFREVSKEMGYTALKTNIAVLNKPYDNDYLNKNFSLSMLTPAEGKERIYKAYMNKMIYEITPDGNIIYKNFGITVVTPDADHIDRVREVAKNFDIPVIDIDPTNPNSIGLNPFIIGNPALCGLIISLVIPFVGTLGDLFFSSVKRHFDIKDFGVLLKSHGGVLDRMDSILFACIVGTLIVALINIF